jgi:hypothetical protein
MDELLNHLGFKLIYVDDDGNMSLITPLDYKEGILENGYRCISHLWGNATRWEDHPIEGVAWCVDLREEKREKLLQIFNHHKGYWWIDVFCTNQDDDNKPLNIMGDVYKYSKSCICLLDIKIPDVVKEINKDYNRDGRAFIDHGLEVVNCEWNRRVWTLQELILPPEAYYTSEIKDGDFYAVDFNILGDIVSKANDDSRGLIKSIKDANIIDGLHYRKDNKNDDDHMWDIIRDERKCKNPVDYFYGIAGVINITLPNGLSFEEVEREFFTQYNGTEKFVKRVIRLEKFKPYVDGESIYKSWKFRGLIGRPLNWLLDKVSADNVR